MQAQIHLSNWLSSDSQKCRCRVQIRSSSCSDLLLLIVGRNGTLLLLTPNNSQEPDDNECKLTVANIDSHAVLKMRQAKGATETEEPFKVLISQSIEFHLKGKKKKVQRTEASVSQEDDERCIGPLKTRFNGNFVTQ